MNPTVIDVYITRTVCVNYLGSKFKHDSFNVPHDIEQSDFVHPIVRIGQQSEFLYAEFIACAPMPSVMIRASTRAPSAQCRAKVAPQPRTSSSGWAATTNTVLITGFMAFHANFMNKLDASNPSEPLAGSLNT